MAASAVSCTSLRAPAAPASRAANAQRVATPQAASCRLVARRSAVMGSEVRAAALRSGVTARAATPARVALAVRAEQQSTAGTPLKSTSVMVVGATGTVGRQVVRRALDEGYDVRCMVRPRQNPADFLRDWGAVTVKADLTKPETIPPTLVGIHTIIDCATARPEESISAVDWEGKKALIQSAKAMGIERYVFLSIEGCDKHPDVPLMDMKHCTELYLKEIGLPYTTLRLCGFMQALIQQYAVPILEEQPVFGTDDETRTAYLDTQDVARMVMAAVRTKESLGKTITLAGPKAYTIKEVIAMCEGKAGSEAQVTKVPLLTLKVLQAATGFFQWTRDASDRLAFANVMSANKTIMAPMDDTYKLLGLDPSETTTLEQYFDDYFSRILKKLKEVGGESRQRDFYL